MSGLHLIIVILSILVPFIVSSFYYKMKRVKWLAWSCSNVMDIHRFHRLANNENLIIRKATKLEKYFLSENEKLQLDHFEKSLSYGKEKFIDDPSLSDSIEIYYDNRLITFWLLFITTILVFSINQIFIRSKIDLLNLELIIFVLLSILCIYFIINLIIKLSDHSPQLILSSKGITCRNETYMWKDILNYGVILTGGSRLKQHRFLINTKSNHQLISLFFLKVNIVKLKNQLFIYKNRKSK
ncbi:hypothetical protein NH26_03080 [Flammeovirga pacifica]|uniref:Uncharacterized protein n=2 Tax=Flammeovirga pacifica TaxID=915059 RepID=A0A1S1YWK1_FLAPC|nr:hypothetical protein NH26_03080 [Flammeovirga pacifica]